MAGEFLRLQNDLTGSLDPVSDDNPLPVKESGPKYAWACVAFEQITVANAIKVLTEANYVQATRAILRLETAEIRYLTEPTNTTVSTTVGTPMEALDILELESLDEMTHFRAIRTTGTSGVLNVTYLKQVLIG